MAIGLSYICLFAIPFSAMFILVSASGAAMTSGGPNQSTGRPLLADFVMALPVIGLLSSVVAVFISPGWKMRLAAVPALICYVTAVWFFLPTCHFSQHSLPNRYAFSHTALADGRG